MDNAILDDAALDPETLRDAARRLLAQESDRRAAWRDAPDQARARLRASMAELGWMALTMPEAQDGLGQDFAALAPIYEEMGRALCPVALAPTLAAVDVLARCDAEDAAALLARIAVGDAVLCLADTASVRLDGAAAHGTVHDVFDAPAATHLMLVPFDGEAKLVLLDLTAPEVAVETSPLWDRSRCLADVTLRHVPCRTLDAPPQSGALARAHLDLAIACDSIGGADMALAEAVAYMGTRRQFDRPIGSFQALKHRAADLKVALEIARAFVGEAVRAFVTRRPGWDHAAGQARLIAADAYRAIAEESVQFHGGIGFTWEHDCHLFLKRSLLNEVVAGTPDATRDRVAPALLRNA